MKLYAVTILFQGTEFSLSGGKIVNNLTLWAGPAHSEAEAFGKGMLEAQKSAGEHTYSTHLVVEIREQP